MNDHNSSNQKFPINDPLIDDKIEGQLRENRLRSELIRDKLKWKVRRRISITAFSFNILLGIAYFALIFILDNNQAEMLKEFNSVIISIVGSNFSIVMLYIGAVTYSDNHQKPNKLNADDE